MSFEKPTIYINDEIFYMATFYIFIVQRYARNRIGPPPLDMARKHQSF